MYGYFTNSRLAALAAAIAIYVFFASLYSIGPTDVGLVRKRLGSKLPEDNPVAFQGEAGYQASLLIPGRRFKLWPIFTVTKHPWVQVPAGQIGIVIEALAATLTRTLAAKPESAPPTPRPPATH